MWGERSAVVEGKAWPPKLCEGGCCAVPAAATCCQVGAARCRNNWTTRSTRRDFRRKSRLVAVLREFAASERTLNGYSAAGPIRHLSLAPQS